MKYSPKMPKRKKADGNDLDGDHSVPIPIQTFLWRQSSPFIRRKLGKLCEASCVVRVITHSQREAYMDLSFERVLVQNILHGLSPSLCEAISSISRWKMIQASFPHVMHCCSTLLDDRKLNDPDCKFDGNQTKLLYTLHWIILDAASECEDNDNEKCLGTSFYSYLHSLDTIQLFIYMFAPLVHTLKDADFQSLKLEPGLRLWQPLWDFREPDVPCFSTPVKAKRLVLKAQRNQMKVNFNTGNIYIGKECSYDGIYLGFDEDEECRAESEAATSVHAPLAHMSDICAWSTTTGTSLGMGATAEPPAAPVPVISCVICQETVQKRSGEMTCKCGMTRRDSHASVQGGSRKVSMQGDLASPLDKDYVTKRVESCIASGNANTSQINPNQDVVMASYCDVAVLRCLFCPQWSEAGVYWALRYLHQRLLDVLDETTRVVHTQHRERSRSLPTPELEKPCLEPLPTPPSPKIEETDHLVEPSSPKLILEKEPKKEPAYKRIKVSEIRHMIGDKVKSLRRRESNEQFDLDQIKTDDELDPLSNGEVSPRSMSPRRHGSSMARLREVNDDNSCTEDDKDSLDSGSDMMRRKSMPVLIRRQVAPPTQDEDVDDDSEESGKQPLLEKEYVYTNTSNVGRALSLKPELLQKPIITITQDSPDPTSTNTTWFPQRQTSLSSMRSDNSEKSENSPATGKTNNPLHRSATDTEITYSGNDEIEEVPGSVFYIKSNGQINYGVVLKAAHAVANRECSGRSCGVVLNILNCLIDLGIIEKKEKPKKQGEKEESIRDLLRERKNSAQPNREVEKSCHNIAMETIVRIFRVIGCPHGCGDGVRGIHGERLRSQGLDLATRLMKLNKPEFVKYLKQGLIRQPAQEVMDFMHAFLGFCVDPAGLNANSPQGKKTSVGEGGPHTGYGNNFGQPMGGLPTVEAQMIVNILQPLVTKFVDNTKEINNQENIGLYCDVRQFLNYVKELHGGIFRKVALSGLLNVTRTEVITVEKKEPPSKKHSKIGRRTSMMAHSGGSINEQDLKAAIQQVAAAMGDDYTNAQGKGRKSLFRRRTKKSLLQPQTASDSEILEDNSTSSRSGGAWSPRVSMSATEDSDLPSGQTTPQRRSAKLRVVRRRSAKSDIMEFADELGSELKMGGGGGGSAGGSGELAPSASASPKQNSPTDSHSDILAAMAASNVLSDHSSPSKTQAPVEEAPAAPAAPAAPRGKPRMTFKTASQATLSFLSARRKVESGIKHWNHKKKSSAAAAAAAKKASPEEAEDSKKETSTDLSSSLNTGELLIVKEKKLVNSYVVKSGMMRFSFMLESCQPGSLPDPHLIAALLELEAPIVSRACLLIECAHFVNRCNRGDWPKWMKLNLPGFRQAGLLTSRGQPSGYRRNLLLQRAAGRMFHMWGEAISNRLCDILGDEADKIQVLQNTTEERRKELKAEEDEEDFLDESTVNPSGSECPFALKLIACQLLLEITTFLRETYQYIPRARSVRKETSWEKQVSNRRYSSILSSPGHSERSNSRSSQGEGSHMANSPSDRKISFAVLGQSERSDSVHSSATSINQLESGLEGGIKGRRGARKLLRTRRGSTHNSSFRRSFKVKHDPPSAVSSKEGGSVKRSGSQKSGRKVSTQSLASDRCSDEETSRSEPRTEPLRPVEDAGEESPGVLSDEQQDAFEFPDVDDQNYGSFMPWIKVVVQIANSANFICEHQQVCHPYCYERQRRSCSRLIAGIRKIYRSEPGDDPEPGGNSLHERRDTLREKLKRRESMFQPTSPKRRESTPLLERMKVDVAAARAKIIAALGKKDNFKKVPLKKETLPILKYMDSHVKNLTHTPISICTKASPILADNTFIDMMPVAWELLLESDQELSASAASMFILSSVKIPDRVQELMTKELQHEDPDTRINAILRFSTLWRSRWQVWPRMEDGANMFFKVPPPSIDFVLPSPTIGLPTVMVIDPPWQPHFKTKVEEVTLNHEESKSIMTATTTRRKQQQEMIHRALLAEEDRRRAARENFLMTGVPVTHQAAYEPALHHTGEEHEEVTQEEMALAARRMSVAPGRSSNVPPPPRKYSGHHGSMFWSKSLFEGEEEKIEHVHSQHLQMAQHFFPSCICAAVLPILHLLEDLEVNPDGMAVCQVAEKVIWSCLTEDPQLFLRMFLEKLTIRDKQEELIFLLRKMLYHMKELPPQTAHCLFNYLVGFIMFYVRSPTEGGQEAIGEALSILWKIVPSVQGIFFKDLKQTLRKEQCDPTLLIMANVPSAKKLIVHGPDLTSIPSQFPIHEDTQFEVILQDSLEFFNIPEEEQNTYFLVDTKTHQMHNLNSYVRDFYFFRRNFYPQLSLVHMNPDDAFRALQKQALGLKFAEMGKVLFTMSVIAASQGQQIQSHVSFVHEELQKLPSFPRKALEADFGLYHAEYGKEVYGVDNLHKYVWAKLVSQMFRGLSSTTTSEGDLLLFLNVVNGVIILHAEDCSMLRISIACFINAARHFKQVFSTSGFLMIMPTLLKVYSHHQANPVVLRAIEFACRQFFLLHRNPFILQMFGSIAPIMAPLSHSSTELEDTSDFEKVSPISLFKLLLALERDVTDQLDVLELVEGEKPLVALDFCYMDDVDSVTVMDAINMCVTVVAYACDSSRAMQMLTILEAILPQYLKHMHKCTTREDNATVARAELSGLGAVAVAMKALVSCSDSLARNFSGPQRHLQAVNTQIKVSQNHHGNHSPPGISVYYDEPSDIRFVHMEEGMSSRRNKHAQEQDEAELNLQEYRRPRNSLITVVAQFYIHSTNRMRELRKIIADSSVRNPELLDTKSHNRLTDIVHALLKIAPYDPATMRCSGLKNYMVDMLPLVDWTQESVRPALNLILRRLERLFSKVYKKTVLRRQLDWESAANMLKGVYTTLAKYLFVAHLPHLKTLINVCLNIILSDDGGVLNVDGPVVTLNHRNSDSNPPRIGAPPVFCATVIKLTAMQMQALGEQYTLETICGGMSVFPTTEKTINMLLNLILPLCIRMGCGRRDSPKMKPADISFAVSVILHALVPPSKHTSGVGCKVPQMSHHSGVGELGRIGSISSNPARSRQMPVQPKEIMQTVAFLGLKIIIVCFEKQLATEWYRIAQYVKEFGGKILGGIPLWQFLDFIVTIKTPLYMMLVPFIQYKMMKAICESEQEYHFQRNVHQKLQGYNLPHPRCKSTLLVELVTDLTQIREELIVCLSEIRPRTGTVGTERSDVSHRSASIVGLPKSSSIHDLLEHQVQQKLNTLAPNIHAARLRAMRGIGASLSTCSTGSYSNQVSPTVRPPSHAVGLRRISAIEGHTILDRFMHTAALQDEDPLPEASVFRTSTMSPRRLSRQGSIYQHQNQSRASALTKQHSLCSSPLSTETLYEYPEMGETANGASTSQYKESPSLQRSKRVIYQGTVRNRIRARHLIPQSFRDKSKQLIHNIKVARSNTNGGLFRLNSREEDGGPQHGSGGGEGNPGTDGPGAGDPVAAGSSDLEPRGAHRLQRQDAKSRKTFKIKRHRSTIKGSMGRSAPGGAGASSRSRHGSSSSSPAQQFRQYHQQHGHQHHNHHVSSSSPEHHQQEAHNTDQQDPATERNVDQLEQVNNNEFPGDKFIAAGSGGDLLASEQGDNEQLCDDPGQLDSKEVASAIIASPRRQIHSDSTVPTTRPNGNAMTSELVGRGSLPDMTLTLNGKSKKSRYISKSRSQDEGATSHITVGTARARIARQGPRLPRSRSPSTSPGRHSEESTDHSGDEEFEDNHLHIPPSPPIAAAQSPAPPLQPKSQAYVVVDCGDSMESLTGENSSLLKHEEKSQSQSSLLIYFDENDVNEGTCV